MKIGPAMSVTLGALSLTCVGMQEARAQAAVGKSTVDGRPVTLFTDGTWAFDARAGAAPCTVIAKDLAFCGNPEEWTHVAAPEALVAAQFRRSDREYLQFVVEGLGADAGLTLDTAQEAVIRYVAGVMQIAPHEVPVLDVFDTLVDGRTGRTVVYAARFNAFPLVFAISLVLEQDRLVQVQSYTLGLSEFSEEHRALHGEAVALVELDGAADDP